ncbi:MAG: nucleotidyltransferase domain-containing protein [Flammeovirgaceae bacterium]
MGLAMHHMTGVDEKREWNLFIKFCQMAISQHITHPKAKEVQAINWKHIQNLATVHQVRPLLFKALSKWEFRDVVPTWFMEQLRRFQIQQTGRCLNHTKELISLIKEFHRENVEIIPYKGVLLSKEVYGDWASREISDIDFLMKLEDFDVIKRIMQSRRYQPEFVIPEAFERKFFKRNCEYNFSLFEGNHRVFHVEPHWILGNKLYQTHLNYHDIQPFVVKQKLFGEHIQMLGPEGTLLTTCLHHGGQDRWRSLKQVSDIAAIINQFGNQIDWELFLQKSVKFRVKNIVLLGIALADEFFQVALPNRVKQLIATPLIKEHATQVSEQLACFDEYCEPKERNKDFFEGMKFQLGLREHWLTKLKILFYHIQHILVPNVYDVVGTTHFSRSTYWLLFLKKPFRLLKGKR